MAITNLIATGVKDADPVGRYYQGVEGAQADVANQQKMQAAQQKVQMEKATKYGEAVAPALNEIVSLPPEQRQAAYQSKVPMFQQLAADLGMNPQQISPQYDDAKAQSVIQRFPQTHEAPKTREVKIGNSIVTQEWNSKTGKWTEIGKGTRTAKSEVLTGEIEATKKTQSDLQEGMINTSELLDSLYILKDRASESSDQFTFWGKAGGAMLKMGERLGVPLPEGGQAYLETRQGLQNYSEKVFNTYRKVVTGTQASKFEIQKLRSDAPTTDDSSTTLNKKLNDWIDDAERLRVRYNRIVSDGFKPAGTDKEGNVFFEKNGKKYEISTLYDIGSIPDANKRVRSIESDLLKNNPDIEDQALIDLTMQKMKEEGYDTRRWGR